MAAIIITDTLNEGLIRPIKLNAAPKSIRYLPF